MVELSPGPYLAETLRIRLTSPSHNFDHLNLQNEKNTQMWHEVHCFFSALKLLRMHLK